jgi:hypothetical protein
MRRWAPLRIGWRTSGPLVFSEGPLESICAGSADFARDSETAPQLRRGVNKTTPRRG